MKKYPNIVLINGQSMYKRNATGITMRSLFEDWPRENIVEFYIWKSSLSEDNCNRIRSFRIPDQTLPLNYLARKMMHGSTEDESEGIKFGKRDASANAVSKSYIVKTYVKYLVESKAVAVHYVTDILEQENFHPDVVYTLGACFSAMNITNKLADFYHCHTCIHYMDNWRETLFTEIPDWLGLNRKLNKTADAVEKRSKCSLVISSAMEKAYQKRGLVEFKALMNSVEPMPQQKQSRRTHEETVNFVYAGGLHLKRYKGLLKIEQAVKNSGYKNARLIIYTSNRDREMYETLFDHRFTVFSPFLPHNQVYKIYDRADVLVHVESFDKDKVAFTKYSMSTKIPEYMMSEKPILCYAPANIAVYEYIRENNAGICADDEVSLEHAVKILISSPAERMRMAKNGRRCACEKHSIISARESLRNVMLINDADHDAEGE